jgi:hypothetical protein
MALDSVDDVVALLHSIGLQGLEEKFRENGINGARPVLPPACALSSCIML